MKVLVNITRRHIQILLQSFNANGPIMRDSSLCQSVVEDLCRRYSHAKLKKIFKIHSYALKGFGDTPSGFLGRHEILCVKIQETPFDAPQEVIFFIKSAPSDVTSRAEYLEEFGVFKKEICVYRDVLPRLQEGFDDFVPKCFYAKDNVLIFEHLGELGFRMGSDRSGILDFDHLNCALRTLARLHAASIVFEVQKQKRIPEMFPEAVKENAYPVVADSVRLLNFNNANVVFCELIKIIPKYRDSARLKYILKEFPLRMGKMFELCEPSAKYHNVFCHGDLWANNFLFRYENGNPVESRLIDFQLTRYAPPILDVITILTIPTSREFRYKHMDELLENYYAMMTDLLTKSGLQIQDYIPQKHFEDSVGEFMLCGLIESCLFSHMTILPPELTQSFTTDTEGFEDFFSRRRTEICLKAFNTDKVYRDRLTDMISDIVDNYILI